MIKKQEKEEVAYILEYLPYGHLNDKRPMYLKKPIVQGVGIKRFVLMEMEPKKDVNIASFVLKKTYIGDHEKRPIIDHVKKRISYNELTHSAQLELPIIIEKIVAEDENRFIKFFNKAYPISTKFHMLELLPGIGKKLMWAIIDERKKGEFSSFKEITERVKGLHSPEKLIAKRILNEIKDSDIKYRVFTTPMPHKK